VSGVSTLGTYRGQAQGQGAVGRNSFSCAEIQRFQASFLHFAKEKHKARWTCDPIAVFRVTKAHINRPIDPPDRSESPRRRIASHKGTEISYQHTHNRRAGRLGIRQGIAGNGQAVKGWRLKGGEMHVT